MAAGKIKLPDPSSGNLVYDDGSHKLVGTSKSDILLLQEAAEAALNGKGGIDSLFLNSRKSVKVDLSIAGPQKTGFGTLTIKSVENVVSGNGNDTLWGSKGNNLLLSSKGHDKLYGGKGNDALLGDVGNDRLYGEDGNDYLVGGTGKDSLYGGKGKDGFIFSEPVARKNMDKIMDFSVKDDTVYMALEHFTAMGAVGKLAAGAFHVGSAAAEEDDRIVYNKAKGALYYDPDGSGAAAAIQFASIGKNLSLSHRDFEII
ncbi:calcium-binding protein [Microvirga lenta]|uniref:calcium-binding protein n=1 Tax=Microvirga lenta TaxID=2881337 RepID=UPI001CFD8560|nr:calcium-binding protein [Microvirga lenta]MCB5174587.1 hypothetical protein [Microvirga lenta]